MYTRPQPSASTHAPSTSNLDFAPPPEAASDVWPVHGPGGPKLLRRRGPKEPRALKPIEEESPQSSESASPSNVLNRLKERSIQRRLRSERNQDLKHSLRKSKVNSGVSLRSSLENCSSTAQNIKHSQRPQIAPEPEGDERGKIIASLVKRFRESPPMPRSERSTLFEADGSSPQNPVFWWSETDELRNSKGPHSSQTIPLDGKPPNTPNFFECDSADLMEADSVLEKTKQVIQEDMKHKEMLDKLMKKYITSEYPSGLRDTKDNMLSSWEEDSSIVVPSFPSSSKLPGQSSFSFWDSPEEEDILEKWRRKCKSEIDIPVVDSSFNDEPRQSDLPIQHAEPPVGHMKSQLNTTFSLERNFHGLGMDDPSTSAAFGSPMQMPSDSRALLMRCRELGSLEGSPMELDSPDPFIKLPANENALSTTTSINFCNPETRDAYIGSFQHANLLEHIDEPSVMESCDKTPEKQDRFVDQMMGSPMDLDDNKDDAMLEDTEVSDGVNFFISLKQQAIPGLPPLPRSGTWNDTSDSENSSGDFSSFELEVYEWLDAKLSVRKSV